MTVKWESQFGMDKRTKSRSCIHLLPSASACLSCIRLSERPSRGKKGSVHFHVNLHSSVLGYLFFLRSVIRDKKTTLSLCSIFFSNPFWPII